MSDLKLSADGTQHLKKIIKVRTSIDLMIYT